MGGQRDMFDEVLKFGAFIVDALVGYTQPVFIYLPPFAELRGGAWVVVDPTINKDCMEMFAAPGSRGGVLEPSGIIPIKYRTRHQLQTMHRLDDKLIQLVAQRKAAESIKDFVAVAQIAKKISEREKQLIPVYRQIAEHFADLHDRPGRMAAKGVISAVVPWENSRQFFYHRLVRKLE